MFGANRWMSILLVVIIGSVLPAGCTWMEDNPKAVGGTAIGAVTGAAAGGLITGRKGAVWGSVLGALAGGAIGAYLDHQDKGEDSTKRAYNYDPAQGIQVKLEDIDVRPDQPEAGETVNLKATYAVMTPQSEMTVKVTEKRVILYQNKVAMEAESEIDRKSGTFTSTVPLTLPRTAEPGVYTVQINIRAGTESSSTLSESFTIK